MSNQALVLKFGTDFKDAQRSLASLASQTAANMATVSTAALGAAKALGSVGAATGTLSTALNYLAAYKVAMLALGAAVTVAGAAIEAGLAQVARLDEINKGADKAGVSTDFFHAWESQAVRFKASIEEMHAALTKFKTDATSSISEEGQRVNSTIERIVQNAIELKNIGQVELVHLQESNSTEEKIKTVIGLVKQLYDEAKKTGDEQFALLGDKLAQSFGPKWQEIASAIRSGTMDVDALAGKLREAGTITDTELNDRARQLNAQLTKANASLSDGMKPFLEDIARLGLDIQGGWVGTIEAIARAVNEAAKMYRWVKSIADEINALGKPISDKLNWLSGADQTKDRARGGDALRYALEKKYGDPGREFKAGEMADSDVERLAGGAFDPRKIKDQKWTVNAPGYREMLKAFGQGSKRGTDFELDESGARSGKAPRETAQIDQVENYIRSLEKQNASLGAEASAIGKSNVEREKAIDLARADEAAKERGSALTDAERQRVSQLAEAHAQLRQKIDDATRAKQQQQQQQQFFGDAAFNAVDSLIIQHKKLKDVLGDVARAFEQAALKSLLLGQGPLASMFGMAGKDGGLGGILGSIMGWFGGHAAGGVVGRDGAPTLAPIAAFAHARAYANGGAVGIIAHAGEVVLNQAQQNNVAAGLRGNGDMRIEIQNHGVDIQTQQLRDNRIRIIARQEAASGISSYDAGLIGRISEKQARSF